MGDLHCRVCGEPWDAYGVFNGDMTPEEKDRFLRGEGCPSCKFGEREKKWALLWKVVESFQYAICQVADETQRRVAAEEFVLCLNRRGIISNDEASALERQILDAITKAIYVPIDRPWRPY